MVIGYRNEVQVDCAGLVQLAQLRDYQQTVQPSTWKMLLETAQIVKDRKIRVAFFNSTPQGGTSFCRPSMTPLRPCRGRGFDAVGP